MRPRRVVTVALVGPDGSGKTTVCRRLVQDLGRPATYVYMGVNLEASETVLPTTRLLLLWKRMRRRRPDISAMGPTGPRAAGWRGMVQEVKALLRVLFLMSEEQLRWMIIGRHLRRGRVVICDRHFLIDYHTRAGGPDAGRRVSRRLHESFVTWRYRSPDLVVVLDAPAELLFRRKPEGTLEARRLMRERYARLDRWFPNVRVIDAAQPVDDVARQARGHIEALFHPVAESRMRKDVNDMKTNEERIA